MRKASLFMQVYLFVCLVGWLVGFLTSSTTRLYRGRVPRLTSDNFTCCPTHETELGDHDFGLSRHAGVNQWQGYCMINVLARSAKVKLSTSRLLEDVRLLSCYSSTLPSHINLPLPLAYVSNTMFLYAHYQSGIFLAWSENTPS